MIRWRSVADHHLKELRKAIGKTQAEVAQILGVSQSRVSQIENGDIEAMDLETLRAYASALGGRVDITVSVGPPFHQGRLTREG
ncbi:helix-turn-helix domain-containing protein [Actinomadura viridis]|uniref:helix-turn-helix domain-containing protein n=1 Tax=Actinomadura viridis TaxID=58110 RepID=UPI00369CDEA7